MLTCCVVLLPLPLLSLLSGSFLRWVRNDGLFTDCETDSDCEGLVGTDIGTDLKCGALFGQDALNGGVTEEVHRPQQRVTHDRYNRTLRCDVARRIFDTRRSTCMDVALNSSLNSSLTRLSPAATIIRLERTSLVIESPASALALTHLCPFPTILLAMQRTTTINLSALPEKVRLQPRVAQPQRHLRKLSI